ncbi:D-Ala-D-Ala carboxypeptidase family metallohydrolase [Roseateles sp. NT4]|uniref:D-Ala-D-Ala carboxypeptidase family metallohydrolase n=1 Tax=Roseateles sp. NT4 TaxID=3453715 RepID=UPI003EEA4CB3
MGHYATFEFLEAVKSALSLPMRGRNWKMQPWAEKAVSDGWVFLGDLGDAMESQDPRVYNVARYMTAACEAFELPIRYTMSKPRNRHSDGMLSQSLSTIDAAALMIQFQSLGVYCFSGREQCDSVRGPNKSRVQTDCAATDLTGQETLLRLRGFGGSWYAKRSTPFGAPYPQSPRISGDPIDELSKSDYAIQRGIDNTVPPPVKPALQHLQTAILLPATKRFGPLRVLSGYRSPALSEAIGIAAEGSSHVRGEAVDFQPPDGVTLMEVACWIKENLQYDTLLLEPVRSGPGGELGPKWIHVAAAAGSNKRKQSQIDCPASDP